MELTNKSSLQVASSVPFTIAENNESGKSADLNQRESLALRIWLKRLSVCMLYTYIPSPFIFNTHIVLSLCVALDYMYNMYNYIIFKRLKQIPVYY